MTPRPFKFMVSPVCGPVLFNTPVAAQVALFKHDLRMILILSQIKRKHKMYYFHANGISSHNKVEYQLFSKTIDQIGRKTRLSNLSTIRRIAVYAVVKIRISSKS